MNIIYIYIYIYIYSKFICLFICKCHLKLSYISILTNLLPTDNETKSVKTINYVQLDQLKKIKRKKSRLKKNIKML